MKLPRPDPSADAPAGKEASAPRALEELIQHAQQARASDIHLQAENGQVRVAYRLDGVMVPARTFEGDLGERIFGRIKFLARLRTYQESLPQDGRIDRADIGGENDIRVATYPTVGGEKIVLRLFVAEAAKSLKDLELPAAALAALESFLRQSGGLLLLTGPAGSGKTTTIYACLRHLAEMGGRHIITIEDPVEQVVPGVMQTEVSEARELTFARAARHLLRQDPQVLVIGEIRDEETARIVVQAALTGHMVIATLLAGSCRSVLERLILMSGDPFSAVSALQLILNQRLVRRVCRECRGQGCVQCSGTGYRGRVPLAEWLAVDDTLRARIRREGVEAAEPTQSLARSARELLAAGWSKEEEIRRALGAAF